jgi:hypothetical protein
MPGLAAVLALTILREPDLGEERIADELRLKLGLTVSPRTVGRYLRRLRPSRGGQPSKRWATFGAITRTRSWPEISSSP